MNTRSYIGTHRTHTHYLSDRELRVLQRKILLSSDTSASLEIMRNLCDQTKLKLCLALRETQEVSVADLSEILGMTQSAVSHALGDLRRVGFVESHRCGKLMCYSLARLSKKRQYRNAIDLFLTQARAVRQ